MKKEFKGNMASFSMNIYRRNMTEAELAKKGQAGPFRLLHVLSMAKKRELLCCWP